MKRFLLLCCTVVLVCLIMVVPAFASSSFGFGFIEDMPYALGMKLDYQGWYKITYECTCSDVCQSFVTDPVYVDLTPFANGNYVSVSGYIDELEVIELGFDPGEGEGSEFVWIYFPASSAGYNFACSYAVVDFIPCDAPVAEPTGSPLSGVFDVFGGVGSWIIALLGSLISIFWNADAGALTFLGVLAVAALALAVVLLLVMVVVRFLRFRS